ncbi:MAG: hypothetical protein CM1200mP2_56920 [Planctomycetaceae bacterium]|nr:MAG: hypothetical protein CM1200mP2_56920 [Planctomycetaceae bacterium]
MMLRWLLLLLVIVSSSPSSVPAADGLMFEDRVFGLLKTYCWKCHGGEGRQAGLDLRSLPLIKRGGKHGPAVSPGVSRRVCWCRSWSAARCRREGTETHRGTHRDDQGLGGGGARARYVARGLDEAEEPVLEESDRQWWAFRPPVRADLPG